MNQWFRFYHEALDDPKVQTLDAETFRDWVNLLCLCCRHGGELPKTTEDIAFALRRSLIGCQSVLDRLAIAGLIDRCKGGPNGMFYAIHGWEKRQYKSDSSTDRVKRYRERSKNVSETPPDTDTDTDTEREEKLVAPLPPSAEKKKATEGKTGSRLPPDWHPSEEEQGFAIQNGVSPRSEAEKFRDYWTAQPGAKGRKTDWSATWRNWVRRAAETNKARPGMSGSKDDNSWLFTTAPKQTVGPKPATPDDVIEF